MASRRFMQHPFSSCRTTQVQTGKRKDNKGMRFCMCAYLRSVACLHARIFHLSLPSTHPFAACHGWATVQMPWCPHTRIVHTRQSRRIIIQSQGRAIGGDERGGPRHKRFRSERSQNYIPRSVGRQSTG
ncbi:hypothetical protein V8C42DRAFT_315864 [Trichoderma barbatum]